MPIVVYKCGKFWKAFLEYNFKFIPCKKSYSVIFKLIFKLLELKADFFLEKQGCKKDVFMAFGTSSFKIIRALQIEVEAPYVQVFKK